MLGCGAGRILSQELTNGSCALATESDNTCRSSPCNVDPYCTNEKAKNKNNNLVYCMDRNIKQHQKSKTVIQK